MKRTFLSFLGGVALCFSMLFSSCGNGDNALEEIINSNSTPTDKSIFADAFKKDAKVSVDFILNVASDKIPIQATFQYDGSKFVYQSLQYNGEFDPSNAEAQLITQLETLAGDGLELTSIGNNQLKFSFKCQVDNYPETTMITVILDVEKNTYAQYCYYFYASMYFDKISINGEDITNQLEAVYKKTAIVYCDQPGAGINEMLRFYYNDSEKWGDVNDRYNDIAGAPLLEDNGGNVKIIFVGTNNSYNVTYKIDNPPLVGIDDKVGYQADGNTANEDGYMLIAGGD